MLSLSTAQIEVKPCCTEQSVNEKAAAGASHQLDLHELTPVCSPVSIMEAVSWQIWPVPSKPHLLSTHYLHLYDCSGKKKEESFLLYNSLSRLEKKSVAFLCKIMVRSDIPNIRFE